MLIIITINNNNIITIYNIIKLHNDREVDKKVDSNTPLVAAYEMLNKGPL